MHKDRIAQAWIKERVAACLQGTESERSQAHNELASTLWPALVRIAAQYQQHYAVLAARSPEIAEDGATHAYIRFLECLETHADRPDIVNWLHATIRNFMLREKKYYTRHTVTDDHALLDRATYATSDLLTHKQFLYLMVAFLGDRHKAIIYYRYWEGLSQSPIAAFYGVTRQNVSLMEIAALRKLRRAFERTGITCSGGADAAL